MGYFDDLCVKADTKPACIDSFLHLANYLIVLALQSTQRNLNLVLVIVLFLGFNFDSIKMEVGISDEEAKAN